MSHRQAASVIMEVHYMPLSKGELPICKKHFIFSSWQQKLRGLPSDSEQMIHKLWECKWYGLSSLYVYWALWKVYVCIFY